jgi:hypothetical protein
VACYRTGLILENAFLRRKVVRNTQFAALEHFGSRSLSKTFAIGSGTFPEADFRPEKTSGGPSDDPSMIGAGLVPRWEGVRSTASVPVRAKLLVVSQNCPVCLSLFSAEAQ